MATLRILDGTGHTAITYDATSLEEEQKAAVKEAERILTEALNKGATAFDTSTAPARKITEFDPFIVQITIIPRVAGGN